MKIKCFFQHPPKLTILVSVVEEVEKEMALVSPSNMNGTNGTNGGTSLCKV